MQKAILSAVAAVFLLFLLFKGQTWLALVSAIAIFFWVTRGAANIERDETVVQLDANSGESASERRREKERLAEERYRKAEQLHYYDRMEKVGGQALDCFLGMPTRLQVAEKIIEQADRYFAERAFVPFWDAIESAANELARFNEEVGTFDGYLTAYKELTDRYVGTPPLFPVAREAADKLKVSFATAERMQAVVGMAQRDFEFSMIFEQRKTNQLLVVGFRDLADGLRQIANQIHQSTNNLVQSMDCLGEHLIDIKSGLVEVVDGVKQLNAKVSKLNESVEGVGREVASGFSAVVAQQVVAINLLDDIRKHRKPLAAWPLSPHP